VRERSGDMAIRSKVILFGFLAIMITAGSAATAKAQSTYRMAQLNLNLGISKDDAVRLLSNNGYNDIRITRTSFKNVHAEACYKGIRYKIRVRRLSGKVLRGAQIGKCRAAYNAQEIAGLLRKKGLNNITVTPVGRGRFRAKACENNERVQLRINPFGEILQRTVTGRCQRGADVAEIRRQLRNEGFTKIQVQEKNQQRLVVQACFEGDRMRLRLAADGTILRRTVIGVCAAAFTPRNIAERLRELGYRRIKVIDDELPVYQAEACRRDSLIRVRMNRFGEIMSTSRLGQCAPRLNRGQVVAMLQKRGARRVEILKSDNNGFRATACYRLERRQYTIDPYGVILNREVVGRCGQAPRLDSVVKDFRSQGIRNLRILVEGCRRGRRLQIELDQYGDEIGRERVGRC